MGQRVTKVKIKQVGGSFSSAVPIGVESDNVTMSDGSGLNDALAAIKNSITSHSILSWADYNNLTENQKKNGTVYLVY